MLAVQNFNKLFLGYNKIHEIFQMNSAIYELEEIYKK